VGFLLLGDKSDLAFFKNKEDFEGGIYMRSPSSDFKYSISNIPQEIDTIFFRYEDGYFNFIVNNTKYINNFRVLPFFVSDYQTTIGPSVLINQGIDFLNSGDVNLASTFLLRSTTLAKLSLDSDAIEKANQAYFKLLPEKFISIGKELLNRDLLSQAAYYFRQALLIVPSNKEADRVLKETNTTLQKTLTMSPVPKQKRLQNGDPVTLSELRNITQGEFETASSICKKFRKMVETREVFVVGKGLDKKVALPSNYWGGKVNNILLSPEYDIINHLRLHTYVFTGMKLRDHLGTTHSPMPPNLASRFSELTKGLPKELIANPPRILGEIGWQWKGGTVNADVVAYQERLSLIYKAELYKRIKNKERPIILEIGSGYGALAYFLKQAIPQAQMILCDLPESLAMTAVYLRTTFPKHTHFIYEGEETDEAGGNADFIYIPNFIFNQWPIKSIDLAINTLSFAEMSVEQVRDYVSGIKAGIGAEGYLFEQNQDRRVNVAEIIGGCGLKQISTERGQQGVANVWQNP